ncbi:hypothetical protein BHE74_00014172, partial [Ensete ventricosum]
RGEVSKGSAEIFFRKVKFWKEDEEEEAPPVFNVDGVNYIHVKIAGLFFVTTTRVNVSPSLVLELLQRIARVTKDYLGILNEDSLRKNFVLVYELLDEVIQGTKKMPGAAVTKSVIVTEPGGRKREEIFVDIIEKISVTFSSSGYILTSEIDGTIQMKSYLTGSPEIRLALNEDLSIGRNSSSVYGENKPTAPQVSSAPVRPRKRHLSPARRQPPHPLWLVGKFETWFGTNQDSSRSHRAAKSPSSQCEYIETLSAATNLNLRAGGSALLQPRQFLILARGRQLRSHSATAPPMASSHVISLQEVVAEGATASLPDPPAPPPPPTTFLGTAVPLLLQLGLSGAIKILGPAATSSSSHHHYLLAYRLHALAVFFTFAADMVLVIYFIACYAGFATPPAGRIMKPLMIAPLAVSFVTVVLGTVLNVVG